MKYASVVTSTGGLFFGWLGLLVDDKKWITLYNTNQVNDGVKYMIRRKYVVSINLNEKAPDHE